MQKVETMKMVDQSHGNGIDKVEVIARIEDDRELLDETVDFYKTRLPQPFLLLKEALDRRGMRKLRSGATTVEGIAESLPFRNASVSAWTIERMAKGALPDDIFADLDRLTSRAATAEDGLDEACRQATR